MDFYFYPFLTLVSFLGYLDDIPFKIASAFLPPPSVSLPTVVIPDEELFFEKVFILLLEQLFVTALYSSL